MNVKFTLESSKNEFKPLSVRLYHSNLDLKCNTGIFSIASEWSEETESFISYDMNLKIQQLKVAIIENFNICYSTGGILNTLWLKDVIKTNFNRPTKEVNFTSQNYSIYFSDFAEYWIREFSPKWKTSARKLMSKVLISQYSKFVEHWKVYEATLPAKIMLKSLSQEDIYGYIEFLSEEKYAISTIKRNFIERVHFFCNRAESLGFQVSKGCFDNIFYESEEEVDGVYLTEEEIKRIVDKSFLFDQELNIAKQNYLVLLYTGLRATDGLKNIDISNIKDGMIKIKTQKTGQSVVIPLHPVILDVLKQNFGNLPPRMNLDTFNKAIKTICMLCNIDEEIEGKLFNQKLQRKVRGVYPKWKLISSHSCRRGFATIHYGKLPDAVISSVLGWSDNGKMLQHYVQHTKTDYANVLKDFWQTK